MIKLKTKKIVRYIYFIIFITSIIFTSTTIFLTSANTNDEIIEVRYYDRVKLHYYLSLNNYYNQPDANNITNEIITVIYFKHEFSNGTEFNVNFEAHLYLTNVGQIIGFTLTGVENQFPEGHYLAGKDLYYVVEILDIQKFVPELTGENPDDFDTIDLVFISMVIFIPIILSISIYVLLKSRVTLEESKEILIESKESQTETINEIQKIIQDQKERKGVAEGKKKSIKRR